MYVTRWNIKDCDCNWKGCFRWSDVSWPVTFFQANKIEKTVLDTAIGAGIVTSQRVLKGLDIHHSVHFIHKTFQEYCAGMYWQSLLTKTDRDTGKFQEILDQIGRNQSF